MFTKPTRFKPDVVVAIEDFSEKKIDMYHCHESQMYEWLPYNRSGLDKVPKMAAEQRACLAERLNPRSQYIAEMYRSKLIELYGRKKE